MERLCRLGGVAASSGLAPKPVCVQRLHSTPPGDPCASAGSAAVGRCVTAVAHGARAPEEAMEEVGEREGSLVGEEAEGGGGGAEEDEEGGPPRGNCDALLFPVKLGRNRLN